MHFHEVEWIHQTFLDSYFSRKTLHFAHKLREINIKQLTRALRAIVTLLLQMRRKKINCIVLSRLSSIYSSSSTRTLSCQFILSLRSLHLPLSLRLTFTHGRNLFIYLYLSFIIVCCLQPYPSSKISSIEKEFE